MSLPLGKILIGEREVAPAGVDPTSLYAVPTFTVLRPRWLRDADVCVCSLCEENFSQLRRKHHCRQCGNIFCYKCCHQKVALPHLRYDGNQRVCEACKPYTNLIVRALSPLPAYRYESAKGLISISKDFEGIQKLTETGGLHTFIYLLNDRDIGLRSMLCAALRQLMVIPGLHQMVLDAGIVKCVHRIVLESAEYNRQLQMDCIKILYKLCCNFHNRKQVTVEGGGDSALRLCGSGDSSLVLLSLCVLTMLVEDPSTHSVILYNNTNTLKTIFTLILSQDEMIRLTALRTIAWLSMGSEDIQHKIAQEDIFGGHCLQQVLGGQAENKQIPTYAACTVANLAASNNILGALKDLVLPLCRLLDEIGDNEEMMVQIARALANLAANHNYAQILMPYLHSVVTLLVKHTNPALKYQGLRIIMHLLGHFKQTMIVLIKEDVEEILQTLAEQSEIMNAVHKALQVVAPRQMEPPVTNPQLSETYDGATW